MKITLIITSFTILMVLASCNKKHCWQCKNIASGKDTTYCDKTKQEINNIEIYSTDEQGNFIQIDCKKK